MSPFAAIVSQLAAARTHRIDSPPVERSTEREMREGSGPTKVLECIVDNADPTITSAVIIRMTGLDSRLVRTALKWLVDKGKVERVNEEPPYLYRAVDS